MSKFKKKYNINKRKLLYNKIRTKWPHLYPVIVDSHNNNDPKIIKTKYLAPDGLIMGHLLFGIRKNIKTVTSDETILFYINDIMVPPSQIIDNIYIKYKDDDGFLYITYTKESTFG